MDNVVDALNPNEQKPTPMKEVWQRAARTILQLIAAGGLTALTDQLASDLPIAYAPYLVVFYTILVTFTQNLLESKDKIPTILKK